MLVRPLPKPAELVEAVPGLIAAEHSGSGKANQYFLRGFNLDHGTDFTTYIDDVQMNFRTHGHGQGYLDLNGLIPELINREDRSEEHTSELQSLRHLVCRLLLEKKKKTQTRQHTSHTQ